MGGGVFYGETYDADYYDSNDIVNRKKVISAGDFKDEEAQYEKVSVIDGVSLTEWVDISSVNLYDVNGNIVIFNSICPTPTANSQRISQLPRIKMKEYYNTGKTLAGNTKETKERTVFYYFDRLISEGDKYKDGEFDCQDNSDYEKYDEKLQKWIVDDLTLDNSLNYLTSLPDCIKSDDSVKQNFNSEDTFCLKSEDFEVFGKFFQNKLIEYLQDIANAKIALNKKRVTTSDSIQNLITKIFDIENKGKKLEITENT